MTEVEEHNAALEKVTDFVEEKELDTEQTQNALSSLADPAQALLPANESRCAYEHCSCFSLLHSVSYIYNVQQLYGRWRAACSSLYVRCNMIPGIPGICNISFL